MGRKRLKNGPSTEEDPPTRPSQSRGLPRCSGHKDWVIIYPFTELWGEWEGEKSVFTKGENSQDVKRASVKRGKASGRGGGLVVS